MLFRLLLLLVLPGFAFSQSSLKGKVTNEYDGLPVAYASIGVKGKGAGAVADMLGNFSLRLPGFVKKTDTIVISAIGFEQIKLPVVQALSSGEFQLKPETKSLDPVTLKVFSNETAGGARNGDFTYYRGWYDVQTGGEIGRVFDMYHKEFRLEKVRFRIDNQCDTCIVRLHVRRIVNDLPAEELLTENKILTLSKTSADKLPEFDLTDQYLVLQEGRYYIGFEVIRCSSGGTGTNSVCFVGTDYGNYIYKSFANSTWQYGDDYNIYIRYYIKY